jgi:signal transduction histidine kinase
MVGGGRPSGSRAVAFAAMHAARLLSDSGTRRWRVAAILVTSLAPAAMELTRALAHGSRPDVRGVLATTAGVLVLLAALTAAFELALKRRLTAARCFAVTCIVAVAVGATEGLAALGLSVGFGLPLIEPAHRSVVVAARMGAASGVLGMGLFAMAVALPFAASGAREAERLRSVAELARMRANLQPHFLFNTLSTVSALVGEDPREARRLIGALGDLLRDSLVQSEDRQTLGDEIAWLQNYADILETRHRGSLSFRWEIEEATRDVLVPRLLLQPLVENAVKHGALRRPEGGEVAIRARLDPQTRARVTCVVEDNGPGPQGVKRRSGALGLDLVTRRLALEYGRAAAFRLERDEGRTRSVVDIPVERAS